MKPPICPRKHMVPPELGPKTWWLKKKEIWNIQPSRLVGKKGTLKSQFPWEITHLPWQRHNSPRIEAHNLVAQGTREIEIFDQVAPRKKGCESSNQGAPIKGGGAWRRLGFSPQGQGVGGDLARTGKGIDNPQPGFQVDLFPLGKLQLAYRNCIGITFSCVICVVPLKNK